MSEIIYSTVPPLIDSPFRFPIRNNRYEIVPGLSLISREQVFIDDQNKNLYLAEKQKCLQEGPQKYFCYEESYADDLSFIANQLSGKNCFHEMSMQNQQDLAVVKINENKNINIAISLAFPNHWDPREKIGKDFIATHLPVPDMEEINKSNHILMKSCLEKGPYERYAWGISSDTRLNHHPVAPTNIDHDQWYGRAEDEQAYMRIERQTLLGFKERECVLFTIHTYFFEISKLNKEDKKSLRMAIETMSPETLHYKGIKKEKICPMLL